MAKEIVTLALLITGFSAYACMASIQFHYGQSVLSTLNGAFWNPKISYLNKWRLDQFGDIIIIKGKKKEKFLGSSTIFVFLTDGWHLLQFIFLNCTIFAISINIELFPFYVSFLIIRATYAVVFNLLYDRALLKR